MHQCEDWRTALKKTSYSAITALKTLRQIEQQQKLEKQKWEGKRMNGYFKHQIGEISYETTWTYLRKGHLMKETVFLLVAAQKNAIRTNYIKAKIDNVQQKSNVMRRRE